jgi:hypothetical protein
MYGAPYSSAAVAISFNRKFDVDSRVTTVSTLNNPLCSRTKMLKFLFKLQGQSSHIATISQAVANSSNSFNFYRGTH